MKSTRPLTLALSWVLLTYLLPAYARAAVIVFANGTDKPITFAVVSADEHIQAYRLAPGDVLPVPAGGPSTVRFQSAGRVVDRASAPNSICTFTNQGRLAMTEQRFGDPPAPDRTPAPPASTDGPLGPIGTLKVMILVDEDEPAARRVWEKRLRQRVAAASRILEHHCRTRLEVVAVDTWTSDNGITDFSLSLREFERNVHLKPPAQVAIGFTSQYRKPEKRRFHLGGTRGPLHPHLLVREWSQHVSETERLEILVHELGHILGASHSASSTSVMRPLVGDRQSRARSFRIQFDPLNTLAMSVFCEQLRQGGARRLADFSPASRAVLTNLYGQMQRELPDDIAAPRYLTLLARAARRADAPRARSLTAATQSVIHAVTRAARANRARPVPASATIGSPARLAGDELTDYYIRAAAREASRLPDRLAARAYLLGLAVALSKTDSPDATDSLASTYRRYETPHQRRLRLAVLGNPTIHGREDLLRHFVASGALCAMVGHRSAEAVSTLKEVADSRGPTGFSFADLAANYAGIELAKRLEQSRLSVGAVADSFTARRFLLAPDALPKDLPHDAFEQAYGSPTDPRFRDQSESIRQQLLNLPGFADSGHP